MRASLLSIWPFNKDVSKSIICSVLWDDPGGVSIKCKMKYDFWPKKIYSLVREFTSAELSKAKLPVIKRFKIMCILSLAGHITSTSYPLSKGTSHGLMKCLLNPLLTGQLTFHTYSLTAHNINYTLLNVCIYNWITVSNTNTLIKEQIISPCMANIGLHILGVQQGLTIGCGLTCFLHHLFQEAFADSVLPLAELFILSVHWSDDDD